MNAEAPRVGRVYEHLETVGRVDRWSKFRDDWSVDTEWSAYRQQPVDWAKVQYRPARKSTRIEGVRLRDYDRCPPLIDDEDLKFLKIAGSWAEKHFSVCKDRGYYTFEEAVEAIKSSDCANSSPGFPWNQSFKTKKEALSDSVVLNFLRHWVSKLGTDDVISTLFALALKDEILKATKVKEDKTRLFMSAPLEHHLACVMFMGKMHDALMSDRGTWCSAGREFQHGGWHSMMSILPYSWFVGNDMEMYDMSIIRYFFSLVCENVCRYNPEKRAEIEDLFAMALDAFLVSSRGDVFQKHTGNPSGWFLTLFLNTMVNYIMLAYAWLKKFPGSTQADFERLVRAWLCGDDSLLSISKEVRFDYTAAWMSECWKTFGMKCKESHESADLSKIEYCGATSMQKFGIWCRRPRVQKFLDALQFVKKTAPDYVLARALSIYHEMWPVDEKRIVKGYVDYKCGLHPELSSVRRKLELTDSELKFLHLGVE